MKSVVVQLAVIMGLLVVHGCGNAAKDTPAESQSPVTNQSPVQNNTGTTSQKHQKHQEHNKSDSTKANNHNLPNSVQQPSSKSLSTTAKLTSPNQAASTQAVPLEIKVENKSGQVIEEFATPQEKPMHLVVVSDDLRFFNHIHPDYQGKGKFKINHDFPAPGNYTLFTDYQPVGAREQVAVEKITIPGNAPIPADLESFTNTQIIDTTKVQLRLSQSQPKAGKDVKFSFNLIDTAKKQPVGDLQTYLGKPAHLVIIRSSSPLTVADYIHTHALDTQNKGVIEFKSQFPQKGTYKMWLQFQRSGKVTTVPFWVNVS